MTSVSATPAERSGWFSSPGTISVRDCALAVLLVTAIAGTLDIIAAHLHTWAASGNFPTRIFKAIAGGALGRERAMQGGVGMIALGAFFHYFISLTFTGWFFLLYPRVNLLRKNIYATGLGYGMFVWFTMNVLVLPSSALHSSGPDFTNHHTYIGMAVLVTIFGFPIVAGADRFYRKRNVSLAGRAARAP